ncbi:actin-binding Rho-activating protein-like [Latimeria chalumnae]|uniref:Actin-binding Rho-activating protein n=1 Tax=Latimeria chalumnae TaxID=7897 RepID=H3APC6_LATCH|nr:PREDICTED: actin-binding Rho-activating protein-like [Latimeria chalumnae]XP_006003340.1 PREDICTED: actin-binding Rho-activating protein-like [Latimeria chalumnae]|eukprot:XP_006003339.1 PREDICTED: actin-binding Rho-activating protein-like [Latimeria chalumnae]
MDKEDQCGMSREADCSLVDGMKESWQKWANLHAEYQKHNPFSNDQAKIVQIKKGEDGYGQPREGSKTELRGKDAHNHIGREVQELCLIIRSIGEMGKDGKVRVTFGQLFEKYITISNKVVGVLLRARKHGLIHFEGEMLWQRRDDHVIITLLE